MSQTIEKFLLDHLYNNGLFEDQAKQVLEIFKSEDAAKSIRLNGDVDHYPPIMRPVMLMSVDRAALQWIDKEMPNHWARPMFDPKMADELNAIKNEPGFNAAMERINAVPDIKSLNVDFEHESSLHLELGMSKLGAVPRFDVGQPRGDFEGDEPTFKSMSNTTMSDIPPDMVRGRNALRAMIGLGPGEIPLFANAPETGVDVVGAAYLSAFMDFNPLASFNPEVKSGNDVAATPDQAPGETDSSAF